MKTIFAFALLLVCVAQIQSRLYVPCNNHFYTEQHPSGFEVQQVEGCRSHPHPCGSSCYGHNNCKCPRCSPALYTQLHRECGTFF